MNKPISAKDVAPPKVTTGALPGSRKVYSAPEGHDDFAVPLREIALTDGTSASSSEAVGQTKLLSSSEAIEQTKMSKGPGGMSAGAL